MQETEINEHDRLQTFKCNSKDNFGIQKEIKKTNSHLAYHKNPKSPHAKDTNNLK